MKQVLRRAKAVMRAAAGPRWPHLEVGEARDATSLIARHIGFRKVEFCEYAQSEHGPLRGLDTRAHQKDLNLIVELTR